MNEEINKCGLHCIKINNLGVKVDNNEILKDVNIHIHCGQITTIVGKNGAGKSTLLKAIIGEIAHTGNIEFKDTRTNEYIKITIGYVPQKLNIDKNTPMSVYDLFASYISNKPVFLYKNTALYNQIKKQLDIFEVGHLIDHVVSELSGGELQRVLLSIATKPMPNLLVLDEPVSGVDRNGMFLFYETISLLKNKYDMSILLVSHDLEFVYKYSDKVILLDKTIITDGNSKTVFKNKHFVDIFGNISYNMEEI